MLGESGLEEALKERNLELIQPYLWIQFLSVVFLHQKTPTGNLVAPNARG